MNAKRNEKKSRKELRKKHKEWEREREKAILRAAEMRKELTPVLFGDKTYVELPNTPKDLLQFLSQRQATWFTSIYATILHQANELKNRDFHFDHVMQNKIDNVKVHEALRSWKSQVDELTAERDRYSSRYQLLLKAFSCADGEWFLAIRKAILGIKAKLQRDQELIMNTQLQNKEAIVRVTSAATVMAVWDHPEQTDGIAFLAEQLLLLHKGDEARAFDDLVFLLQNSPWMHVWPKNRGNEVEH